MSYFTDILYTERETTDGTMIYGSNELLNRYSSHRAKNNRWNYDVVMSYFTDILFTEGETADGTIMIYSSN